MNKNTTFIIIIALIIIIVCGFAAYKFLRKNNSEKDTNSISELSKDDLSENKTDEESGESQMNLIKNDDLSKNSNEVSNNSKILIAFFSRADENYSVGTVEVGNTEIMAGFIKDYFRDKATTFKIEPVNSYPANYNECTRIATEELNNDARPEFIGDINIEDYDTIFLGYPIWWGDVPMIINTFLEKYDFSGKTIIPFNTHEGSGSSGTYESIKNKMNSSNVITKGLAIQGSKARKEESRVTVEKWLKELGY